MNFAHLHLALTHVPVLGSIFGLLLLAYAMARRSEDPRELSHVVGMMAVTLIS